MVVTNEQIKIFTISVIIGTIIYMIIYSRKGKNKSVLGYFGVLKSCFSLAIISIFIIFGVYLIKVCLTQQLYLGVIIPIVWFFIAYIWIKNILNRDFGLDIHIIRNPKTLINIEKLKNILPHIFLLIGFAIGTFMIFFKALPDKENQPNGPIPLLIVGLIFLGITIAFAFSIYLKLSNKTRKNLINSKYIAKEMNNISTIILLSIFILVGILCMAIGIQKSIQYKEKVKTYKKTQGIFINSKEIEPEDFQEEMEASNSTYILTYAYEVNGKIYTVSTDYETAFIPEEGSKKTVLYNPDNPEEAIIEGNTSSIFVLILGIMFSVIPSLILVGELTSENKNGKMKKILEYGQHMLIGVLFICLAGSIYYFMCAGTNDISIKTAIETAGFLIVFPVIFGIAGIIIIGSTIYSIIKKSHENEL